MKTYLLLLFLLFFAAQKPAAQINWQSTNGPEGADGSPLYSNDQYVFYSDAYSSYRSSDGANWETFLPGNLWPMAILGSKIVAKQGVGFGISPDGPKFVVSNDNGDTWMEAVLPPAKATSLIDVALCTHGIYVLEGSAGVIHRSQDDAFTWDTIAPPNIYCRDLWAFEDNLYCSDGDDLYKYSLDNPVWTDVSPPFMFGESIVSIHAVDSVLVIATDSRIWTSLNFGATGVSANISYSNPTPFVTVGNRLYKIAGSIGLVYSENQGQTWNDVPWNTPFFISGIAAIDGKLMCSMYYKGVYRFDEASNQMIEANNGLNSASVYAIDVNDEFLWAACGNGVFAYDLQQQTWVDVAPVPFTPYYYNRVAVSESGVVAARMASPDNAIYVTVDGGVLWDTQYPFGQSGRVSQLFWIGESLFAKERNSSYSRWDVAIQEWNTVPMPFDFTEFQGKYYGFRTDSTRFVSSTDQGVTWQNEPDVPGLKNDRAIFSTEDRLFMLGYDASGNTALYTSADAQNWTYANTGLPQLSLSLEPPSNDITFKSDVQQRDGKYFFILPSHGLFVSLDTCRTWLPITRNGRIVFGETTMYTGDDDGGVRQSGIPQKYGSLSRGTVFNDTNNNGLQDNGEVPMPGLQVGVWTPPDTYTYWFYQTDSVGRYAVGTTPDEADTLRVNVSTPYVENINPPLYVVTNSGDNRNFGVHMTPNITDLCVKGSIVFRPRPGFDLSIRITTSNVGTVPAGGKLAVKLDPDFHWQTIDPPPSQQFGADSLVWDFAAIPLFDQKGFRITGWVDTAAILGDVLEVKAYVYAGSNDADLSNNTIMLTDTIVGSFDPNEKRVQPADGLTAEEIAAGKDILYTVHFQNTGTYPAERVRITDMLDTALDLTTLRLVYASHEVTGFQLYPGGLLEILFDHIFLPDSNSNEAASHGSVTFAIQRKKQYQSTFKIYNKAAIFFDFNAPIITNRVLTRLKQTTVQSFEPVWGKPKKNALLLYPNPAGAGQFTAHAEGKLSGRGQLVVFDAAGRACKRMDVDNWSQPVTVSIPSLVSGIYNVKAVAKNGVLNGTLLVQKK